MNKKISTLFWLLTGSVFIAIYGYRFVVEGMFADGLVYSAIARNLAIGKGAFWTPFFSSSFWSEFNSGVVFYEHPPLVFYIQSFFFKIFGEHHYVEKFYSLVVFIFTIVLFGMIWRLFVPSRLSAKGMEWLPALLYISMMEVEWTTPNNMLDNSMGVFCLLAVYLAGVAFVKKEKPYLFISLSALAIVGAFLAKGPIGLFPLLCPAIYCVFYDWPNVKVYLKLQLTMIGVVFGAFVALFAYPPSSTFLTKYINQQVVSAFAGKRESVGIDWVAKSKFYFGLAHQFHLIVPILVLFFIAFIIYIKSKKIHAENSKPYLKLSGFFLFVGMCGSLPIGLSSKQNFYYMVPSLGFYALGVSILFFYLGKGLWGHLSMSSKLYKILLSITIFLLAGVSIYSASFYGKYRSYEQDVIIDVNVIDKSIPKGTKVAACSTLMTDFNTHVYLQRYVRIELTSNLAESDYYIEDSGCVGEQNFADVSGTYSKMDLGTFRYTLYKKNN